MDKQTKNRKAKKSVAKKKTEKEQSEKEEQGGIPDMDFKKLLGCG